jgi:Chalcone isomerase-like
MRYIQFLIILLMFGQQSALAKPACVADIKASKPYGKAEMNKLFFHVYDAEFWSDANGWSMKEPNALHLTYHVDIDSDDFVERSLEELDRNPNVSKSELSEFAKILPKLMPNVVEGDSITAAYLPENGLQFCHNNKPTGAIKDVKMATDFLKIWLGENTSEPDMRKKLLRLP